MRTVQEVKDWLKQNGFSGGGLLGKLSGSDKYIQIICDKLDADEDILVACQGATADLCLALTNKRIVLANSHCFDSVEISQVKAISTKGKMINPRIIIESPYLGYADKNNLEDLIVYKADKVFEVMKAQFDALSAKMPYAPKQASGTEMAKLPVKKKESRAFYKTIVFTDKSVYVKSGKQFIEYNIADVDEWKMCYKFVQVTKTRGIGAFSVSTSKIETQKAGILRLVINGNPYLAKIKNMAKEEANLSAIFAGKPGKRTI